MTESDAGATRGSTARMRRVAARCGRPVLLGAAAVAAVLPVLGGCGETEAGGSKSARATPVTTVTARVETLQETARGIGSLQAVAEVEIRAEVAGVVEQIRFEEGQRVARGDLLLRLDDEELQRQRAARQAALKSARADLTNAAWNLERLRRLREQGVAATEEFKDARDRHQALQARVEQLAAEVQVVAEQIEDTRVRAPRAGRMTRQLVDVGDFVDAGDQLTYLYTTDPLEVAFWLPEEHAGQIRPGLRVLATSAAYPDREFDGEVVFVGPVVDPASRRFRVKAHVANPDRSLKPGAFVQAEVVTATHADRPVVPEECLVSLRTGYVVFVVEGNRARRRDIEIDLRAPGRVAVAAGIRPGDEVVRTGHMRLQDGDTVRVVRRESGSAATTRPATRRATRPTEAHRP